MKARHQVIYCFLFLIVIELLSCQHQPTARPDLTLPAVIESYFLNCSGHDGAVRLQLLNKNKVLGQADLEWLAPYDHQWIGEFRDPLARLLLSVKIDHQKVTVAGPFAEKLPSLDVDEENYLLIDGHKIGIKVQEIACLLQKRLPPNWRQYIYQTNQSSSKIIYIIKFVDQNRLMEAHFYSLKNTSYCAMIDWWTWLGLKRHQLRWCVKETPMLNGVISIDDQALINWTDIDGLNHDAKH